MTFYNINMFILFCVNPLADEGRDDEMIAEALKVGKSTVSRIRTRYCEGGLDFALHEKARSGAPPKIDGRIEAQLTLLACSEPPDGRSRWTVRLLADRLIEMEVVEAISHMSVQRLLKKMKLSLG
jgi:transposase